MQVQACVYSNLPDARASLFEDYSAGTEQLPSRLAQTMNTAHTDEIWVLSWDSSGSLLASGSKDSTILLWSCRDHALHFRRRLFGHTTPITSIKWHPTSTVLMSISQSTVLLHRADTGSVLCEMPPTLNRYATGRCCVCGNILYMAVLTCMYHTYLHLQAGLCSLRANAAYLTSVLD